MMVAFWKKTLLLSMASAFAISFACAAEASERRPENSPFGVHNPYMVETGPFSSVSRAGITPDLADIGAGWVRVIVPELKFAKEELDAAGVNILAICGAPGNRLPPDERMFAEMTRRTVRQHKSRIKYWEVGNEPDMSGPGPRPYAALLKATYRAIKDECPECQVVLGGLAFGTTFSDGEEITPSSPGPRFLNELLEAGAGGFFDILAFHFPGGAQDYVKLTHSLGVFKKVLRDKGVPEKPVWITEMSTYDGTPAPLFLNGKRSVFKPQTEAEQAAGLIKMYVFGIRSGVKKMFWNLMVERHGFGGVADGYYDNVGLVHNPKNDGKYGKKLAYYAFKKMTEVLDGADWDSMAPVIEGDGVYVYRVNRRARPVYVAWAEGHSAKQVKISFAGKQAKLTYGVPKDEPGRANKMELFEVRYQKPSEGSLSVEARYVPVFIEAVD